VRQWVRGVQGPTAIDLFCGAGGLGLGLHNAGVSVLVGADSDPCAIETYGANLPCLTYGGDLADPTDFLAHARAWGITSVDVVAGGVPCQPFSRAGRSKIRSLVAAKIRHAEDARVDLWQSFVQVVEALHPRAIILENVPDLAEWDEGAVLVGLCDALRSFGYDIDAKILHAYEHGVPQHRSRLFIVGVKASLRFRWPPINRRRPTLWDAISDLPIVIGGNRTDTLPYAGPTTELQRRLRMGVSPTNQHLIHDHITRDVRADDLEAFQLLPEGGTYDNVPENLRRYRSDIFTDKYNRLSRGELSRTITAHIARDGYSYIHPVQHRTLSVREAARIQTFPDWFRFAGEPSHRYRQIGNAVPVLMAESLGRALNDSLEINRHAARRPLHTFRAELGEWHVSNRRTHPWRRNADPWNVLLGEMCLQRTGAEHVNARFEDLIRLAHSPADLIANESEARRLMESRGLHWGMDNILKLAHILVDQFGGKVPPSRQELLTLPGVGDYVANAVLCFGFEKPSILMDSNTARIASRVMGHGRSGRRWQLRLDLYRLAGSGGADAEFNNALLDLAAMVCRPTSPRCLVCPVARHCQTFRDSDS
jgi:DNA (cytosine-5)-methyltransferase 1